MTDEQAFAWLRSLVAPNVGEIAVVMDVDGLGKRLVLLEGATEQQVTRVHNALAIRFVGLRFEVEAR